MPVKPADPEVLALRSALIRVKAKMRIIAQDIDGLKPLLEAFGNAPTVKEAGVLQMQLTGYRQMFGQASLLVEDGNVILCEAHQGLWDLCIGKSIPHEPEGEQEGGGGR